MARAPATTDSLRWPGGANGNRAGDRHYEALKSSCIFPYFCYIRRVKNKKAAEQVARYADMFFAMGAGPRLRIMQLLLSAHPQGLVVGDIQGELGIPNSTLSHHLEKLKNEDLVKVRRDGTFLWYTANADVLRELLGFLYAECCTRNKAVQPDTIITLCS